MTSRRSSQAFTLVEVLTVIVIILIIAAWVVSAYGPGSSRAARTRAMAEIQVYSTACESFKADYGDYPREDNTTEGGSATAAVIDPKVHGNPMSPNYQAASRFLYKCLSGDYNTNGRLDSPDEPKKGYMNFDKNMLGGMKDSSGRLNSISYIQDPFGNSYGYATGALRAEEQFHEKLKTDPTGAERAASAPGFNGASFDLWSTAGKILTTTPSDMDRNRWVKNW